MQEVTTIFSNVLLASWGVLLESAPFVLLGFFIAGLLKAFLPENFVANHLGGNRTGSIIKASLFGIPIPLCSCGVLPAAAGLKKQGAGKGAIASFLISTPETGVDSIAVSYALLDPLMTVFRPLVAFFMAIATGIAVSFSGKQHDNEDVAPADNMSAQATCASPCCCSHIKKKKMTVEDKLKNGMNFAFGDLLKDVGLWLFIGILLSGLISVFVSPEMVSRYLSNEYLSMAFMLVLSVPLYVCATASTPVVAALALKGISPGAALVFLLVGPATNAASLPVIFRLLGRKATVIYLLVIVVISMLAGVFINALYGYLGYDISNWVNKGVHEEGGIVSMAASVVLVLLVLKSFFTHKHVC
ncbi:MAG: SO_0444 family Cu/Zn efflux transporter [Chlorobiaceae bacterium]|nr:SO_0444 family Cu/Zn efflux transporter [Chlorobiaceae bacterium]NTV17333.1 SO_0444 family Cu/Zn efflux transporter [Chlorobiaceae bacterium]